MKKIVNIAISCLFYTLMMYSFSSCSDELLLDNGINDGRLKVVNVTVSFKPNTEIDIASRSANGDCMQNINSLRMVVYDENGNLLPDKDFLIWKDGHGGRYPDEVFEEKNELSDNRTLTEKENNYQDIESGRVTYKLRIPTGKYYIYAIANADDLQQYDYETKDKLKSINREWKSDLSLNSEMFGIFDTKENRAATDIKPIEITSSTVALHCWLKRLASKVTIAFDGTELFDNVQVFIDSVAIHDIPKRCSLGYDNVPGKKSDGTMEDKESRYNIDNGLYYYGDTIKYQDVHEGGLKIVPENFLHVCNGSHPYFGKGKDGADQADKIKFHAHTAKSLFFYENMQGDDGKDKRQDATGAEDGGPDGKLDHPGLFNPKDDLWKDCEAYGTYIEVTGWYRCISLDQHVSEGKILYRFMLGKDEKKDYNAERNTHYKLTLCFKGYGNDADWHIEYNEERNIQISTPQYISYLYNKKMMANIKINGKLPVGAKLKATIVDEETSWKPWGDGSTSFPIPSKDFYSSTTTVYDDGPWNTFLSLRQTRVIKIEDPARGNAPSNTYPLEVPYLSDLNKNYYINKKIGVREYEVAPNENGYEDNSGDGMYFVQALSKEGEEVTSRLFSIPLYTRAKELVTRTGFTGNNPYTSYPRKGKIKFEVLDASGSALKDIEPVYLDIIQVRRVVNPKGVWRKAGSTKPFRVTLLRLPKEEAEKFEVFTSEGKWSAEVISEPGRTPVTLSSTKKGSGEYNADQISVSRISGESEHPIDFMINFNGTQGCAIIRVRYHNYTCEHDIFCRNGYETPIQMTNGSKILWPSYNISHFENGKAVYTKSPLEEGAMFRRGCTDAILAENGLPQNMGGNGLGLFNVTPSKLKVLKDDKTTSEVGWSDIKQSVSFSEQESFENQYEEYTQDGKKKVRYVKKDYAYSDWKVTTNIENERIAKCEDYYTLISEVANDLNFPIKKAYGVLYGDGAEETQENVNDAYGYAYTDGTESPKGMRGVFVYNKDNCRQIFFPVGASGYGHRNTKKGGVLRYAGRDAIMNVYLNIWPLFYDLYKRPGAIYWCERYYKNVPYTPNKDWIDNSKSSAFDMNYFTMGFEGYGGNDAMEGSKNDSHACFIRTVIENP